MFSDGPTSMGKPLGQWSRDRPTTPVIGSLARPLQIGPYRCDTPVVLAPMAGITNPGFRRLCREQGAGFYVCEMITSRAWSSATR